MTAPHFFGALVRALGLYWLSVGLSYLAGAYFASTDYTPMAYVIQGMADLIIGAFLMFKADGVVETCYSYAALKGQEGTLPERSRGTPEQDA